MTNQQRQSSLDKQRVLASKELAVDVSGGMPYCDYCDWQQPAKPQCRCLGAHEQRVKACACATAYNRMVRGTKNG